MTTYRLQSEQRSRLVVALGIGLLVFALGVLLAALVAVDVKADRDSTSRRPVTCLPNVRSGGAATTNHHGSGARRPAQQPRPKAPAAKVPAAPKAPAPKAPVAPPRLSLKK